MLISISTAVNTARQKLKASGVSLRVRVGVSTGLMSYFDETNRFIGIPRWQTIRTLLGLRRRFIRTVLHEFGHAYVTTHQRQLKSAGVVEVFGDFEEVYPNTLNLLNYHFGTPPKGFLSCYAAVHPEEDFAEVFAWVVWHEMKPPRVRDRVLQRKITWVVKLLEGSTG